MEFHLFGGGAPPKHRRKAPARQSKSLDLKARQLMTEVPWAEQFDPENARDRSLVLKIDRLQEVPGVEWVVKCRRSHLSPDGTGRIRVLLEVRRFFEFPTLDVIESAVSGTWGGGRFEIWSDRPRKRWHQVNLPGPALDPTLPAPERTSKRDKGTVEFPQFLLDWLDRNPVIKERVILIMIANEVGIPVKALMPSDEIGAFDDDPESDPDVRAFLDNNPEAAQRLAAGKLAQKYGGNSEDFMPKDPETDSNVRLFDKLVGREVDWMLDEAMRPRKRSTRRDPLGEAWADLLSRVDQAPLFEVFNRLQSTSIAQLVLSHDGGAARREDQTPVVPQASSPAHGGAPPL